MFSKKSYELKSLAQTVAIVFKFIVRRVAQAKICDVCNLFWNFLCVLSILELAKTERIEALKKFDYVALRKGEKYV